MSHAVQQLSLSFEVAERFVGVVSFQRLHGDSRDVLGDVIGGQTFAQAQKHLPEFTLAQFVQETDLPPWNVLNADCKELIKYA